MGNEKGIAFAVCAALVSGFSVFLNGVAVSQADPFAYTTLKGILAVIFLAACVMVLKEVRNFSLSRKQWAMLALVGIIGGSVPFLMFFWGLKLGGAAVSSFIYRSLFIFAGVFGYLVLKEKPSKTDFFAGLAILLGNALLVSGTLAFGFGQMLVLGATVLWALEYTISRKIMADVHPRVVMISRMFFGSLILLGFLAFTGSLGTISSFFDATSLMWLLVTSGLLFAFLSTWYFSLKYLPVFKAACIFTIGGVVTAALNLVFLGKAVSLTEAFALVVILSGALAMIGLSNLVPSMRKMKNILPSLVE
jgi:drug/metabolite transporter (DMT)-like permease